MAFLLVVAAAVGAGPGARARTQTQAAPFPVSAVTIVLPPKLMAAHPATLAVFGIDGKLAAGISVDLSDGESVVTDRTGRAHFTAPAHASFLIARAAGATATALIDPAAEASEPKTVAIPPFISTSEHFRLCAADLQGDASADRASINGHPALIIAASPECVAILPPPDSEAGRASISVNAPGVHWTASTTLVSLAFVPPRPALLPGQKGRLIIRVKGSTERLRLVVENTSPDVLRFLRGDVRKVRTSGGARNSASLQVQAIRSGDFSFHARIVPAPDRAIAARYAQAAAPYAPRSMRGRVEKIARQLSHGSGKVDAERHEIARILNQMVPGAFRTLLDAAYSAL